MKCASIADESFLEIMWASSIWKFNDEASFLFIRIVSVAHSCSMIDFRCCAAFWRSAFSISTGRSSLPVVLLFCPSSQLFFNWDHLNWEFSPHTKRFVSDAILTRLVVPFASYINQCSLRTRQLTSDSDALRAI